MCYLPASVLSESIYISEEDENALVAPIKKTKNAHGPRSRLPALHYYSLIHSKRATHARLNAMPWRAATAIQISLVPVPNSLERHRQRPPCLGGGSVGISRIFV